MVCGKRQRMAFCWINGTSFVLLSQQWNKYCSFGLTNTVSSTLATDAGLLFVDRGHLLLRSNKYCSVKSTDGFCPVVAKMGQSLFCWVNGHGICCVSDGCRPSILDRGHQLHCCNECHSVKLMDGMWTYLLQCMRTHLSPWCNRCFRWMFFDWLFLSFSWPNSKFCWRHGDAPKDGAMALLGVSFYF